MRRAIFKRIDSTIRENSIFVRRQDETGPMRIHLQIRIIYVLRGLAYGMYFDQTDKLCKFGETTNGKSFFAFCEEIVNCFSD